MAQSAPPPVMTWGKATPVLAVALVFYVLRLFFEWLVITGPILAAVYCTLEVSNTWISSIFGTETIAAGCTAASAFLGVAGAGVMTAVGIVMAMLVGIFGWLCVGTIILVSNPRLLKANQTWFLGVLAGFVITETPFVGSLPGMLGVVWHMYRVQIRKEKEEYRAWEEQHAQEIRAEQAQIAAMLAQRDAQTEEEIPEE